LKIKNYKMRREKFLTTVTGGLAAVCVSCLTAACSKDAAPSPSAASTPITTPGTSPGSNAFTVKLDTELKAINDFISKSGIILIRLATGNVASSFLAVSSVCPHAGATVEYNNTKSSFLCSAHGSTFGPDGSLVLGPATKGLTKLLVEITGTTLTVK
jgi:Rieske Fe-S protein